MTDLLDIDLMAALRAELETRASRASQVLEQAAREVLSGPRSGKQGSFHGAAYQMSAPGEPPAERSGALLQSWRPLVSYQPVVTGDTLSVTAGIHSDLSYAVRFDPDLSPYQPGAIAPRPFVAEILDRAQPAIEAIMAEPFALGGGD